MKFIFLKCGLVFVILVLITVGAYTIFFNQDDLLHSEQIKEASLDTTPSQSFKFKSKVPDDIRSVSLSDIVIDEDGGLFYTKHNIERRLVYNSNTIQSFYFSPLANKYGFVELDKNVTLHVGDVITRDEKVIYSGSLRTTGWEWFTNDEIHVYYNCGTECQAIIVINPETGERIGELVYGVNYEWAPNKELVLAYHYTVGPGITVGDKHGQILFNLIKDEPFSSSDLLYTTKALWSPQSDKLALIVKKKDVEILELLVFDILDNFKKLNNIVLQGGKDDVSFFWDQNRVLMYNDSGGGHKLNF